MKRFIDLCVYTQGTRLNLNDTPQPVQCITLSLLQSERVKGVNGDETLINNPVCFRYN